MGQRGACGDAQPRSFEGPRPLTASVAAVMAAYPIVGWGEALLIGLPIAAAGIILGPSPQGG
jgi:hypothetical protein